MTTPAHNAYGFAPKRTPPNPSNASALNLTRSLSDISFNTEESKSFLPDPPEDPGRSVSMKSKMDDKPASERRLRQSSSSIATLKKRLSATSPKETTLAVNYDHQRAQNLEVLRAFAERVSTTVDPSMTLYLERTLYAALQQSWLLGLGGVGLMCVGDASTGAIKWGIMLMALSMVSAIGALVLHYVRLHQIKSNRPFKFWQTALFTSLLTVSLLLTISLEVYYGILYPYLLRTATVAVENPEVLLPQSGHSKQ